MANHVCMEMSTSITIIATCITQVTLKTVTTHCYNNYTLTICGLVLHSWRYRPIFQLTNMGWIVVLELETKVFQLSLKNVSGILIKTTFECRNRFHPGLRIYLIFNFIYINLQVLTLELALFIHSLIMASRGCRNIATFYH